MYRVQVPATAAESGHADILKMAVSKGLPLPGLTMLGAIKGRNLECLKIAHAANPSNVPKCAMVFAVAHAFLDGVRYLDSHGVAMWGPHEPLDAEGLYALCKIMRRYLYQGQWSHPSACIRKRVGMNPLDCTWETAIAKSALPGPLAAEQVFPH
jgi:hypothetical protein